MPAGGRAAPDQSSWTPRSGSGRDCKRHHLPLVLHSPQPTAHSPRAEAAKSRFRDGAPVVIDQLCRAVLAIDHAVLALRQGAVAAASLAALDQAHAAVHQLPRGLTEQVLNALLHEIEECRRRGCRDSPSLQMHIRIAANYTLRLPAQLKARQPPRLGRPDDHQ